MRKIAMAMFLLLLLAARAMGWSDAGHKLVASIAFAQLSPSEQQKLASLLKEHPRYEWDFARHMPEAISTAPTADKNEWIFQQAAVWPDLARNLPEAAKETFNRPFWHWIDIPTFLTPEDQQALEGHIELNLSLDPPPTALPEMNVVQQIRYSRKLVVSRDASVSEKALMLSWIMHTVGDIHQPLHSTSLFSRKLFPTGDQGGNLVLVTQGERLHSFWDQHPEGRFTVLEIREKAQALMNDPEMKEFGRQAAELLDEKTWMGESRALAAKLAYTPEVLNHLRRTEQDPRGSELTPLELSESYVQAADKESTRRIVQAGYRFGAVLKAIADQ